MAAIASRYARALVEVVLEQKTDPDVARQQLNAIVQAVHDSTELRRVWESPAVSAEQKRAVLDAIVGQMGITKTIRNFVAILIDHRRIAMLDDVARQFDSELNAQLGLAEAEVSSARPLSGDGKRELESQLERLTGKKVRATYSSDPELLGGVVVRVGSTIYDGSVRGQLEKIKQELSTA
ncbi:MAG: ATP synthase F1 subunit delta [Candidatus Korobacteraceae bacterium]